MDLSCQRDDRAMPWPAATCGSVSKKVYMGPVSCLTQPPSHTHALLLGLLECYFVNFALIYKTHLFFFFFFKG